jgi:hypothetical protein
MTDIPSYIPGQFPLHPGPLGRYLPPLPEGVAAAWLKANLPPGSWVIDPFGSAPRLALEAARAGYRVLAAANNPIARFLLELYANPPSQDELRAALADLAATFKGSERLELHLRGLYQTVCAACGKPVEAEAFIWERLDSGPAARLYTCPFCTDHGERPATPTDADHAARFAAGGLHRARALERVTPLSDPDRIYVEEALEHYPPRAVYALFNLVNKLEAFPPSRRRLVEALLLAAFDRANTLWAYPAARSRPRQLVTPSRFIEKNVWLALEEAIESWSQALPVSDPPTPLVIWPAQPPPGGGISLFEGRLKDLTPQSLQAADPPIEIGGVLAALPRPNQAFWTLSALWAGWLWGHAAVAPFKVALRRRRYDWNWHCEALASVLRGLASLLPASAPALAFLSENEPGFLAAALLAGELAHFDLQGVALRLEDGLAQISWRRSATDPAAARARLASPASNEALIRFLQDAARSHLRQRGEPCAYLFPHAAACAALSTSLLAPGPADEAPGDLAHRLDEALEATFLSSTAFARYGGGSRSPESGLWWLDESGPHPPSDLPLADRVEMEVVRFLSSPQGGKAACRSEQVDRALCAAFPGLLTPPSELGYECLRSYAEREPQEPPEGRLWRLRLQDLPAKRRLELGEIRKLLQSLGEQLGYRVENGEPSAETAQAAEGSISGIPPANRRKPLLWYAPPGEALDDAPPLYTFYVIASAVLGNLVFPARLPALDSAPLPSHFIIVLPGGRAGLVSYKLRRDPRLRGAVESGWRFLKFRHLRWLSQTDRLERTDLDRLLDSDPLAEHDPQMSLL